MLESPKTPTDGTLRRQAILLYVIDGRGLLALVRRRFSPFAIRFSGQEFHLAISIINLIFAPRFFRHAKKGT